MQEKERKKEVSVRFFWNWKTGRLWKLEDSWKEQQHCILQNKQSRESILGKN